jgi:UDP-glucose 4-epimerase
VTGPVSSRVVVLGGSGFVGTAISAALARHGADVVPVAAPRLSCPARSLRGLRAALATSSVRLVAEEMSTQLAGCSVVVNAAGVATATGNGDDLFGANALLPGAIAAAVPAEARLLHVSSAAVQGRRPVLDESRDFHPFSPYSLAKALGEQLVGERGTSFRPTSVHGPGRGVTRSLVKLCSSPLASVAGDGSRPTPQVLVDDMAEAIAFAALWPEDLPQVVLQPSNGLTTAELVRLLGDREPHHVPERWARLIVTTSMRAGGRSAAATGVARRLEMLWFGQEQSKGWLEGKWASAQDRSAWAELRR